jgi:pimeloyl-ACP methyl ester carboxylesterase
VFLTVGDAQLFTLTFGPRSGRPILGIGGWIGSWELWAGPFALLSEKHRAIAFDHRGSGATITPLESITFERLVDDIFAVMDAFALQDCVLAAESMGAAVALGAALKHPERIAALVLVDGMYASDTSEGDNPFLERLRADYAGAIEGFTWACVPEPENGPVRRWGKQILARADPGAAIALLSMSTGIDLRSKVSQIQQPVLILHGSADRVVPIAEGAWLAENLLNARLVRIDGAGHVPTMTHPDTVAREIETFLESFSTPASAGADAAL